jgi:hypothetical protein
MLHHSILAIAVCGLAVAPTLKAQSAPAPVVATLPDSDAIAEDIAWDPGHSAFLVSDVRRHRLHRVGLEGRVADFGAPMPPGWAVLGVAVDAARGVAWATTVTLPQAEGYTAADSGRAAILRLDLETGAVQKRYDLPGRSRAAPGDVVVATNHDLIVGDGMVGAVYLISAAGDSLQALVRPGLMRSTQQPALSPDGRTIFIPHYGRGIVRIERASGEILGMLAPPVGVSLVGIDGLVMRGRDLIAVQNGINPNRILRLVLNDSLTAVVRAETLVDNTVADEPTHVAVAMGSLYLIGNAGWNKYGDDGAPRTGVPHLAPRILRIALPSIGR